MATNGDLGSYLPLAGGTMTGSINMDTMDTSSFGSGTGSVLGLANAAIVPSVDPTAGGVI